MKRILLIALALVMMCSLFACGKKEDNTDKGDQMPVIDSTVFVQFKMKDGGTFIVELYPQYAPETVANFKKLVSQGFYDGLTFHRVYEGFMIQGGDPNGNGTGTLAGGTIYGEFASNGFTQNTLKHERGVISMARRNAPNSASCQFFIMHEDNFTLDGKYAAFGRVISGMEVVDAIATVPVTWQPDGREKTRPIDPPVMESVKLIDVVPK